MKKYKLEILKDVVSVEGKEGNFVILKNDKGDTFSILEEYFKTYAVELNIDGKSSLDISIEEYLNSIGVEVIQAISALKENKIIEAWAILKNISSDFDVEKGAFKEGVFTK